MNDVTRVTSRVEVSSPPRSGVGLMITGGYRGIGDSRAHVQHAFTGDERRDLVDAYPEQFLHLAELVLRGSVPVSCRVSGIAAAGTSATRSAPKERARGGSA